MKQIGYTDIKRLSWGSDLRAGPDKLYIPEPGTRENIDADQFEHVGWIIPGDGQSGLGVIYDGRMLAGDESRPAYVQRRIDGPIRSMETVLIREVTTAPTPSIQTVPTDKFLSEALEFCNERLDEHRGSISSENAYADCNRANSYIRELVRRLQSQPAPLDGLTGTEHTDLRKAVATLEAKFSTLARIQQHGSLTEQPMTFYDHAFIAAYMDLRQSMSSSYAIEQAHTIAGQLTRNRANQP